MKMGKRLAAFVAALTFAVLLLPSAAFAASSVPGSTPTATPATTPTATATATQEYEWSDTQHVTGGAQAVVNQWNSYAIGTGTGDGFVPVTSVERYKSELTLRVYFTGTQSKGGKTTASISGFSGNFAGQDATAIFHKDCLYIEIAGIKYTDDTDNDLHVQLAGYPNIDLQIGEATRAVAEATPTPTATTVPTATPDPRAPGLIVKSSSISEESVSAGDEFQMNLTVYATASGTEDVLDVLVSIAPAEGVMVSNGSSTKYIGTMKPGTSQTVSFPLKAQADFTKGVSTVAVTLSGSSATAGTAANATGTTISVPINQPDRFQISKVEVPESIMVGEEQTATITFVNMGKNPVNNLTLDFACDNCQQSKQNQYVGNLAAGTEDSVDFDLCPIQAGALSGTITVTYEASNGETVTQTQDVSTTVEEMMMPEDSGMIDGGEDMPVDAPAAVLPWWGSLLIVAAIVAVIVIVVLVLHRRKAKKQQALEAEDEDI